MKCSGGQVHDSSVSAWTQSFFELGKRLLVCSNAAPQKYPHRSCLHPCKARSRIIPPTVMHHFLQMKTPKQPTELHKKKLTRLKRHEILDGVGKGGSGEGRVWEEGGPRKAAEGRRSWRRPGQGGPGKGRSREEGQGRGPQTHCPNWPKGASFPGLVFRFLGSLVWENHKAEKKRFRFPFREVGKIAKVEKRAPVEKKR